MYLANYKQNFSPVDKYASMFDHSMRTEGVLVFQKSSSNFEVFYRNYNRSCGLMDKALDF